MNINLTLIGQSIAFAVFVWFCLKYIWPPLLTALDERKARIAEGLAAAEEGMKARERADEEVQSAIAEARDQAKDIIANAQKRANEIVDEARSDARTEGEKLKDQARSEITQEINESREALRSEVVALALAGAEQVLMREVDSKAHDEVLDKLAAQL